MSPSLPQAFPLSFGPSHLALAELRLVESSGPVCGAWAKAQGEGRPEEQANTEMMEKYQGGSRGRGEPVVGGGHREE